ncbi:MAG: glycosyltransferase family 1 protein [Saprospiraceae bacterium]|uniref:Glycosyltransferase family 1 protein n=1 Tax=Candidatus Opimibacter skivensis TaxID=2982028 RepID=A0A9D7XNK3_9BACT|nr:glycosyltransferase family 1 protein [Candidatus Opimibacter skivensis]
MITTTHQSNTIASYYSKHLASDPSVKLIPAYSFDLEDDYIQKGLWAKVSVHLRPQILTKLVSAYLEDLVQKNTPDALLIIKGQFVSPSFLEKMKKKGIYLINYNPDHPLYFETDAPGNRNVKESIELYDLIFTYSSVIKNEISIRLPLSRIEILPFGYEDSYYSSNLISDSELIRKVVFAGTADKTRSEFIKELVKNEIYVDVYGGGFNRYFTSASPYLTICPSVSGLEYFSLLQRYMISMNLYRQQNKGGHNMRSFEIPSVGGLQLVEYSDQMNQFFMNKEEVFLYKNPEDVYDLIYNINQMTNAQLMEMKKTTRAKTLNSKYSYKDRAMEFMKVVNSII